MNVNNTADYGGQGMHNVTYSVEKLRALRRLPAHICLTTKLGFGPFQQEVSPDEEGPHSPSAGLILICFPHLPWWISWHKFGYPEEASSPAVATPWRKQFCTCAKRCSRKRGMATRCCPLGATLWVPRSAWIHWVAIWFWRTIQG